MSKDQRFVWMVVLADLDPMVPCVDSLLSAGLRHLVAFRSSIGVIHFVAHDQPMGGIHFVITIPFTCCASCPTPNGGPSCSPAVRGALGWVPAANAARALKGFRHWRSANSLRSRYLPVSDGTPLGPDPVSSR